MVMRIPQRATRQGRQKVSVTKTYSAPIGGWNSRDALAAMRPEDAVILNNWYPRPSSVEFRGGYASHATGMTGNGKTLAVYNKLTGSNEMYCYTASNIYAVGSAGAVGAGKLVRTNGKHQWTMFGDGTSNWLIAVNGADKPAYYDGTTWTAVTNATTPALTGYTADAVEQFINIFVFKGRLIFIPISSLSFWYLSAGVAGGALTQFDLSGEAPRGGYLMAGATWTRDAGSGPDDYAVFVTSEGEAIVYQGTDPSSATTWAKVGTYKIGKPIGRRCIMQYGNDCVILTEDGAFQLNALLQAAEDERGKFALSYKIQNAMTDAARSYGGIFGWRSIEYPAYNALLVNIPLAEDGEHQQYVMNTITKAWTRFTAWNAEDFAVFNGELYFCNGTAVYKAWTGTIDGSNNIVFYGKQAFQDFGSPDNKHVEMFMPFLATNGSIAYGIDIDTDFEDSGVVGTASYTVTAGTTWGSGTWDESYWGSGQEMVKQWSAPASWPGRWISTKVKIESNELTVQWMASSLIYSTGNGL